MLVFLVLGEVYVDVEVLVLEDGGVGFVFHVAYEFAEFYGGSFS